MYDLVSGVNVAETRCLLVDGRAPRFYLVLVSILVICILVIAISIIIIRILVFLVFCLVIFWVSIIICILVIAISIIICILVFLVICLGQHHHSHPRHCSWHHHSHPSRPDMKVNSESWSYGILFVIL